MRPVHPPSRFGYVTEGTEGPPLHAAPSTASAHSKRLITDRLDSMCLRAQRQGAADPRGLQCPGRITSRSQIACHQELSEPNCTPDHKIRCDEPGLLIAGFRFQTLHVTGGTPARGHHRRVPLREPHRASFCGERAAHIPRIRYLLHWVPPHSALETIVDSWTGNLVALLVSAGMNVAVLYSVTGLECPQWLSPLSAL